MAEATTRTSRAVRLLVLLAVVAIVAAVAVVLPTSQTPASDAIMNALRETARNISRELGATSWPPRVSPADD
jgi:hypothetical protein